MSCADVAGETAGEAEAPAVEWPVQLSKQLTEDQLCVPRDAGRAILAHGTVKGTICAVPAAPGAIKMR